MSNKIAILAAATVPLLLSSGGVLAAEPSFHAPTTDRAQQTQVLLARAAQAITVGTAVSGEKQISKLWLFPTSDQETVFAQYTLSGGPNLSKAAASEEHFELLRISGNRIVEQRDLTHVATEGSLQANQPTSAPDWTASIGTGHAASAFTTASATTGSPASPHWTALIGTGRVSDGFGLQSEVPVSVTVSAPTGAQADWTAKIGTGHAADSSKGTQEGSARLTTADARVPVGPRS